MTALNKRKKLLSSIRDVRKIRDKFFHQDGKNVDKTKEIKCRYCQGVINRGEFIENLGVCQHCGEHLQLRGRERLDYLMDRGYKIVNFETEYKNPINFPKYGEQLEEISRNTGLKEALTVALGRINKNQVCVVILEPAFLMGSMGSYVGEELTRAFEFALRKKRPLVLIAASGGARMQEGIFSLMQMAKTSAAVNRFREKRLLFMTILTNPTMGGVSASVASLGDIIMAEPRALIGFAGPRVIEQTINQQLPEGFQRAEKLVECGFVDLILPRKDQKEVIGRILDLHRK